MERVDFLSNKTSERRAHTIQALRSIVEQIRKHPCEIRKLGFPASTAYYYAEFLEGIGVAKTLKDEREGERRLGKLAWVDYDPLEEQIARILRKPENFQELITHDTSQNLAGTAEALGVPPTDETFQKVFYQEWKRFRKDKEDDQIASWREADSGWDR